MDANVLEALDRSGGAYKRPALSNIIIYGRIRCLINRPDMLGSGVKETNGNFAIIDAYALKCLGEDYFRDSSTHDVNSVYFTKGSILIYIADKSWVGRDVKVFGKTKYYGATIRRQDSSKRDVGITAFVFGSPETEGRSKVFPLLPNAVVGLTDKDPDARGTVLEDFIVLLGSKKGDIPYPETLDSIIPYTGVDTYDEIPYTPEVEKSTSKEIIKESETKEEPVKSPQPNTGFVSSGKRVDISKIDMHLTFHLDGQKRSEYFEPFKDDISNSARARADFASDEKRRVSELISDSPLDDLELLNKAFVYRIVAEPQRRLGGYATIKCKNYIDTFLNSCSEGLCIPESQQQDMNIAKVPGSTKEGIAKMKKAVLADPSILLAELDPEDDADLASIPVLKHTESFAVNVIGTCTGIGYSTLKSNMNYCFSRVGISTSMWIYMLIKVPYLLGLMGIGLSLVDCDILYYSIGMVFGADEIDDNDRYRAYLVHLDTLNNCSNGNYSLEDKNRGINTFVKIADYKRADLAYPQKNLGYLKNNMFMAKPDVKDVLEVLLDEDLAISRKQIPELVGKSWYSDDYFQEMCDSGIINTLDGFCALERNIESEFLIYEVFEEMGKKLTGITDTTIERVISEFEADRGFKLEGLQREGIKLCKYRAGVLSGCAGSGKTTTSDCMTEVLNTLGDNIKIVYCTPTGKACRRLAEVVHSTVRTIHSQFGVGMGGVSYIQSAYKRNKKASKDSNEQIIYILDEMAMCNTNLMYNIAKNVSDSDMIYFLGDIKQLPPIGGGCPFKILMTVLPCVELGVSKRAAEGSLVNYNTSLINFMSDTYCQELMYDDKTFIARDCADVSILSEVKKAFLGFMDGTMNGTRYQEDDIQVISGYQAKTKLSSTVRLNIPLQEALRANDTLLYYRETRDAGSNSLPYYKNDRVIYINKNSYDLCRYAFDGGVFHKLKTFGCVNGEMGKLVAVIPSKMITIKDDAGEPKSGEGYYDKVSSEELDMILERYESKKDDLRNDEDFKADGYHFVVIRVYDSDLRRDVYVLLRGKGRYSEENDLFLSGTDLDNLALAYALTCHKMQGSQSKVVIMALESTGSPNFMNRNMLNTIITRSQGIVCCVGSVLGEDSMLNKGRRFVSRTDSRDILSVMSGNIGWLQE